MRTLLTAAIVRSCFFLSCCLSSWSLPLHGQQLAAAREAGHASTLRALTPGDLARLEEVGEVAFSPDGRSVVYVHRRPLGQGRDFSSPKLGGDDRADLWLAGVQGGAPVNLTNGAADGSGYWNPVWSPDGAKLALFSTRGGGNVRLHVWDKASGQITRLSDRGVRIGQRVMWLGTHQLAAVVLPDGEHDAHFADRRHVANSIIPEWKKAWEGREPARSVLESGIPIDLKRRPHQSAILFDVRSSDTPIARTLCTAAEVRIAGVSSDGRYVACEIQATILPPTSAVRRLPINPTRLSTTSVSEGRWQLTIAAADGQIVRVAMPGVRYIVPGSFQWAPAGERFAFLGVREGEGEGTIQLFRGGLTGALHRIALPIGVDPRSIIWVDRDRFLLSTTRTKADDGESPSVSRTDWWLVALGGSPRDVTATLAVVPETLFPVRQGTLVGVADGDVWRFDASGVRWTNLTATFAPRVTRILSSSPHDVAIARSMPHVLADVSRDGQSMLAYVHVTTGQVTQFSQPPAPARLLAYATATYAAVFTTEDGAGTVLTLGHNTQMRPLVTLNTFIRDIAEGAWQRVNYRGLDGQPLTGWVLLPIHYQAGTRVPLVALVYAGAVYEPQAPPDVLHRINSTNPFNMQLLAARGYAVLFPSMPLGAEPRDNTRMASDPYFELTKGVLPAVEQTVSMGIADSERVAVMGASYGGYSTYGLITQTHRFKAAVAWNGVADLVSAYGFFAAPYRYGAAPQEHHFMRNWHESGQGRMGAPPWQDLARYIRNSPLTYVQRVQTPLLIIDGDLDGHAFQGEQFFTALYRQGKRARYIRYWGEGHSIRNPAGVRDFWKQIYDWLDAYLQ